MPPRAGCCWGCGAWALLCLVTAASLAWFLDGSGLLRLAGSPLPPLPAVAGSGRVSDFVVKESEHDERQALEPPLSHPEQQTSGAKRQRQPVRFEPPPATVSPEALEGDRGPWLARIRAVQQDCGLESEPVSLQPGGGFASKFQMAIGKAVKIFQRGHAVRFVGHFGGYSAIQPCKDALGLDLYKVSSFTCFFQSERWCGKMDSHLGDVAGKDAAAELKGAGKEDLTALFQAAEAYFFRFNEATVANFVQRGRPLGLPVPPTEVLVGVHVRRGDKVHDPYNRYYTSREYADAIRQASRSLDRTAVPAAAQCTWPPIARPLLAS